MHSDEHRQSGQHIPAAARSCGSGGAYLVHHIGDLRRVDVNDVHLRALEDEQLRDGQANAGRAAGHHCKQAKECLSMK